MELTEEIKDLLKAHNLASITDFVNEEKIDFYLDEVDLSREEIKNLCEKYDGHGMDRLEDIIINKLKKQI